MGLLWKTGVINYDEGLSAEVSQEMYVKHEFIYPTFNGEGYLKKPPMLYWGQMLGYRFFGLTAFGARFINALAGIATVLLLFLAGRKPLGKETAFKAAIILGTSLFFVYLSRVAMTDMLTILFFMLCLCFSWWGIERLSADKSGAPLFWLGCAFAGLAVLTNGSLGVLFPLVTVFFYLLSIGRLRLLFRRSWSIPGLCILLAVGLSWYLLLSFSHPQGFSSMKDLLVASPIKHFTTPLAGHSGPAYFYLVVFLIGFMPWSGFLPFAVIRGRYLDSSNRRVRFLRLFLIFSIVIVSYYSFSATKLPNYICPALPGLAMITATLFDQQEKTRRSAWTITTYFAALLVLGVGILFWASPILIDHLPQWLGPSALKAPVLEQPIHLGFLPYLCGLVVITAAFLLIWTHRTQSTTPLFAMLAAVAMVVSSVSFFLVLPAYDGLIQRPLVHLAEQAKDKIPADGRIVMLGVSNKPSVNFYSHRKTINVGLDTFEALKKNLQDPHYQTGISTEYYLSKLNEKGVSTESLSTDHGYVLFRLVAGNK